MFSRHRPRTLRKSSHGRGRGGFTLLEVLVTLALIFVVLVVLFGFTADVDRLWKTTATDPFVEAESAFENVAAHLAGATLEPYQDYADVTGAFRTASSPAAFTPDHPARRSDLAFACGPGAAWLAGSGRTTAGDGVFFVAPQGYTQTDAHLGLDQLLNALGYFVDFADESDLPAFILPGSHHWRWRLKEILQPAEGLGIYAAPTSSAWIEPLVQANAATPVLAENVIALIVLPERSAGDTGAALAPAYDYDSRDASNPVTRHQLPPRVRLALVAIDEASAQILAAQNGAQPPALVPANLFTVSAQLDADLASLDATLTGRRIAHRILEREIILPAAAWTNVPSS
jgi:uncharacterized protein (TIGR02599 family)